MTSEHKFKTPINFFGGNLWTLEFMVELAELFFEKLFLGSRRKNWQSPRFRFFQVGISVVLLILIIVVGMS